MKEYCECKKCIFFKEIWFEHGKFYELFYGLKKQWALLSHSVKWLECSSAACKTPQFSRVSSCAHKWSLLLLLMRLWAKQCCKIKGEPWMQCWCPEFLCREQQDVMWLEICGWHWAWTKNQRHFLSPSKHWFRGQKPLAPGRVENKYKTWAAEPDKGRAQQHSCFGPLLMHCSGRAH